MATHTITLKIDDKKVSAKYTDDQVDLLSKINLDIAQALTDAMFTELSQIKTQSSTNDGQLLVEAKE